MNSASANDFAEVSGRVLMSDLCSPGVSPAVVFLEPLERVHAPGCEAGAKRSNRPATSLNAVRGASIPVEIAGLQFRPRIRAIALGQSIRFTNRDDETHHVIAATPGFSVDESIAAGESREIRPGSPGVVKLACAIHLHMREFVVVSPTPWVQACSAQGDYRIERVPAGRYMLTAWHEMGEPQQQEITVPREGILKLSQIVLSTDLSLGTLVRKEIQSAVPVVAPVRPWGEVLDRISVLLAAAIEAATVSRDLPRAQRLIDDNYWGEFEASELESAVRLNLGFARAGALSAGFMAIRRGFREAAEGGLPSSALATLNRKLLLDLVRANRDLDALGVHDNSRLGPGRALPPTDSQASGQAHKIRSSPREAAALALQDLKRGFHKVQYHADRRVPEDAAAAFNTFTNPSFQSLSQSLLARDPLATIQLERELNTLRGDLASGLRDDDLLERLDGVTAELEARLGRLDAIPPGSFVPPFLASLAVVLTGAALPILLLTISLPRAVSAGKPPGSIGPVWVFLGGVAIGLVLVSLASIHGAPEGWWSFLTAVILAFGACRRLVREEGDPPRASEGSSRGSPVMASLSWGLFLTAALAASTMASTFREMIEGSDGSSTGYLGLLAGLLCGVLLLAAAALATGHVARSLTRRAFATIAGLTLLGAAVVLAGEGVYALQNSGIVDTTPLGWPGPGIPLPGLHPSLQVVSIQILLLTVAAIVWVRSRVRSGGAIYEPDQPLDRRVLPDGSH